jgi:hypothetical protein
MTWRRVSVMLGMLVCLVVMAGFGGRAAAGSRALVIAPYGGLDCNGLSKAQLPMKLTMSCADVRGIGGERFEESGRYVGHDEPSVRFVSNRPGSGNDITWVERLPRDPSALPGNRHPGSDVTHMFELTAAPWFSMQLCDPRSYPLSACTPRNDANAPSSSFAGGGSAFMELQFYAPGFAPIMDAESCDNTHWCSALTIDSLECNLNFVTCNPNCTEPINFAFLQKDGVPAGPPAPNRYTTATFTPNRRTLLMNPGDWLRVHIFDARMAGGGHALETRIDDLTTGRSGFMIASAKNGFENTSFANCSGHAFTYQPEYNTDRMQNVSPWAALQANTLTEYEIGHFEPCTRIRNPFTLSFGAFTDTAWATCRGPYEETAPPDNNNQPESTDAPCYFKGDTHGGFSAPDLVSGCEPVTGPFANDPDLDYDGTSYWPDWPSSLTPKVHPSPFLQRMPTSGGRPYAAFQFQTDLPATESTCQPTGQGCTAPPTNAPGHFYPWWTIANVNGSCAIEFGQMRNGNTYGRAAQYGTPSAWFFGTLEGPFRPTPHCS